MISKTEETIERVVVLIEQLQHEIENLKHELRFQPHSMPIVDATKEEMNVFKRSFVRRFVDAFSKGWIY
jgi:hypothetical protein